MFAVSLIDKSPLEAIQCAYAHFEELAALSSFSEEAKLAIYTIAIRTYCYDHDAIVSDDEIRAFLESTWADTETSDFVA